MSGRNSCLRIAFRVAALMILCSGCGVVSSYRTDVQAPEKMGKGVSYYLPKRDVIVTLTVGDNKPADDKTSTGKTSTDKAPATYSFSVASTEAYPDTSHRFLAQYRQSLIGKDTLKVGVNTKGLLNSTTSTDFQSQLPTILTNIAKDVGSFVRKPQEPERKAQGQQPTECNQCTAKGSYPELIRLDKEHEEPGKPGTWEHLSLCGYHVTITRLGGGDTKGNGADRLAPCSGVEDCQGKGYDGFFYRQLEPYLVKINEKQLCKNLPSVEALVFSPNNSPLELLPVERGLFADANTSFEFEDGSLKSYEQSKASEISALTALPADIASAYFSAIGNMFNIRKTATASEADYDKARVELLLQQQKLKACMAAIATQDKAVIDANCK